MIDFLLQMGLSNACFALVLALLAMAVGAKASRPHLAHTLWLLVFVKLVTPPLVTVPVGLCSQQPPEVDAAAGVQPTAPETAPGSSLLSSFAPLWKHAKPGLVSLWLLGSMVVLVWSMTRVHRFGRLLAAESDVPPPELLEEAEKIARRLGLATTPTICTMSARLSPMVWWTGGPVRVVIPRALLRGMEVQDWQWILAHELAHVRRRDYLVRWVEWLACVSFWWNPVVWWAQRNLRAMEEICCDDLVISTLHPKPKSYADSLLSAVEFLARPAVRAPAMASEVNSGGSLERRFRMIVSGKSNQTSSRWLRMCVLACALAVLPLGMASARDYDAVAKRLKESVKQGEITPQQADAMMAVLKKEAGKINKEDAVKKHEAAAKGVKEKSTAQSEGSTDLEAAWKRLQDQVRAGELTKAQALAKMSALKQAAAKKNQETDPATAYLTKVKKDLAAAVEAGKISKEDAAKKYEAAKKDVQKKMAAKGQDKIDLEAAQQKLHAKVRAGELTKEQARAQMAALRKEAAQKGQDSDKAATSPKKVKKDRGAAVETGKIGKEETTKGDKTARKAVKEKKAARKDQDSDKTMAPPTKVKKDLGAGKIGKEDAPKKDIKKKMAATPDNDALARGLKAAVQAGKLTKEEARAKWEALKKEAAPDKGQN